MKARPRKKESSEPIRMRSKERAPKEPGKKKKERRQKQANTTQSRVTNFNDLNNDVENRTSARHY